MINTVYFAFDEYCYFLYKTELFMITNYEDIKLYSEIWESYRRVYPVSYTHWVIIPAIFTEMYRNRYL